MLLLIMIVQKTNEFLIEEGRSAATTLFDDLTPLHFAAVYGSKKINCLLLNYGANPEDNRGGEDTPLELSQLYNRKGLTKLMIGFCKQHTKEEKQTLTP